MCVKNDLQCKKACFYFIKMLVKKNKDVILIKKHSSWKRETTRTNSTNRSPVFELGSSVTM